MEDKNENVESTETEVTEEVKEETPVEEEKKEEVVSSDPIEGPSEGPISSEPEVQIEHEQPSMQMEPNVTKTEPVKKEGNGKVIGIVIAAVVVLLFVVGLLVLPSLLANKKAVVDKEINTVFSEIKKTVKEIDKNSVEYDFDRDSIGVEGTLTVSSNYKTDEIDLSKLKDYAISYEGAIDKKGNQASASLKLTGKKPILDVAAMIKEKNVYVSLGDVFEKTITTTTEDEIKDMELNTLTAKDIEVILNSTEKTIKDSIKKDDITKEKEEKEINGKKGKYTKISYELSIGDTTKAVLNGYLEDDEVLTVLSKATTQSKKELKKTIKDAIDNMGKPSNDKIKVNLYTSGIFPQTKELELVADDTVLTMDTDKNKVNYTITADKEKVAEGTYDKSKKEFTFESKQDSLKVTANLTFKDINNVSGNVTVKEDDNSISLDITSETKTSGKSTSTDLKLVLNYKDSTDKFKVEVNNNSKITVGAKVAKVDTKDTVEMDELTEEDMTNAYAALSEKLMDIIQDVVPAYYGQLSEITNM